MNDARVEALEEALSITNTTIQRLQARIETLESGLGDIAKNVDTAVDAVTAPSGKPVLNLRLEALLAANAYSGNLVTSDIVKRANDFWDFLEGRTISDGERAHMDFSKRALHIPPDAYTPELRDELRKRELENVLKQITNAVDSKGRRIVLVNEMSFQLNLPSALRNAMDKQIRAWTPETKFLGGDPPGQEVVVERNFWHNVSLLARALELSL